MDISGDNFDGKCGENGADDEDCVRAEPALVSNAKKVAKEMQYYFFHFSFYGEFFLRRCRMTATPTRRRRGGGERPR